MACAPIPTGKQYNLEGFGGSPRAAGLPKDANEICPNGYTVTHEDSFIEADWQHTKWEWTIICPTRKNSN
jgi:hypothetical protein